MRKLLLTSGIAVLVCTVMIKAFPRPVDGDNTTGRNPKWHYCTVTVTNKAQDSKLHVSYKWGGGRAKEEDWRRFGTIERKESVTRDMPIDGGLRRRAILQFRASRGFGWYYKKFDVKKDGTYTWEVGK